MDFKIVTREQTKELAETNPEEYIKLYNYYVQELNKYLSITSVHAPDYKDYGEITKRRKQKVDGIIKYLFPHDEKIKCENIIYEKEINHQLEIMYVKFPMTKQFDELLEKFRISTLVAYSTYPQIVTKGKKKS